jgi:hypothetical protein
VSMSDKTTGSEGITLNQDEYLQLADKYSSVSV